MPRFEHTLLAIGLLFGFVFAIPGFIPVWAVLMLASAVLGERAPVPRLYLAFVAPHLKPPGGPEEAGPWRSAALAAAGVLGVGTLVLAVGDEGVAWLFGLAAAVMGALAGVGDVCVGCRLHNRRRSP
ncbi:MAG TPA: DUF4395 family protein [Acidimicrobiia bacterium]|nr:DUF4395 family protein [Acidimicrobiia bacterium]